MNATRLSLRTVRENQRACELLREYFDVEICEHSVDDWYEIMGSDGSQVFGAEGAGGRFLLLENRSILFISSEGAAGVVATDLSEFIDLLTGAPYWSDILKFSEGGTLACMLQTERILQEDENYHEDCPPCFRQELRAIFGLEFEPPTYAQRLRENVMAGLTAVSVVALDGTHYERLFGKFKPSDNPFWRDR